MGLTRFYKTTVFLHLFGVVTGNILQYEREVALSFCTLPLLRVGGIVFNIRDVGWRLATSRLFMVALWNRAESIIFLSCGFFFLPSSVFLTSPNFSRRRLDVCHTSTLGVALVRISDAGLKLAAHGSLQIQDAKSRQKSPSAHHRTTSSGYIFATKAHVDNRKKTC